MLVGFEEVNVTVHEKLIRARAASFETALSRDWKEAKTKVVSLGNERPETFELYKNWLYTSKIFSQQDLDKFAPTRAIETRLLIDAYIMGDLFQDSDFKDAVIDVIIDCIAQNAAPHAAANTKRVYENTPSESPLRKLIVDVHVASGGKLWYNMRDLARDYYNLDATLDIMAAMDLQRTPEFKPERIAYRQNTCLYHEHVKEEKSCYKTRLF